MKVLRVRETAQESLRYLSDQRQRLGVWIVRPGDASAFDWESLSDEATVRSYDLLVDLMPLLTDNSEKPVGVFDADDLAEWIMRTSRDSSSLPILIYEVEPLLATFGRHGAVNFFRLASAISPRVTTVIVSHLDSLIRTAGFPADRTWRFTE